jgi:hemerythrin-like metal-binding protein
MTLLEWREDFSVGVPAVDHEHRELIDLINRLHDQLVGPVSESSIDEFLGEIYARIAAHFALEERIMRTNRYDHYAEHKDDHERLLDDLRDIMDRHEDRYKYEDAELGGMLERWFGDHFRTHDARLHQHLGV